MKRYIKSTVANPLDSDLSEQLEIARYTSDVKLLYQFFDKMKNSKNKYTIGLALLDNPNTPDDIISELLSIEYYARDYAWNGENPDRLRLIDDNYYKKDMKERLVQNPNMPSDLLDNYLDLHPNLRGYVAMNPGISLELLSKLAYSSDQYLRECVAFNPAMTPELLSKLATDEAEGVRASVAQNSVTPVEILQQLANDESSGVRVAARVTLREEYNL